MAWLLMTLFVWIWLAPLQTWAETAETERSSIYHLAVPGRPIAGTPYEQALKIYENHHEELQRLPGAVSVSFSAEGLIIETENPSALPSAVEGLPVFPIPPAASSTEPNSDMGQPPEFQQAGHEPTLECPPHTHLDAGVGRCRLNNPSPDPPPTADLFPPPPGVIVLKPGNVREQADSCPDGFQEVKAYNDWRFCVDPNKPELIPPMMAPPIAGIPFEQALEIHNRHVEELSKLPGVDAVGLGADGIHVYTTKPEILPKEVEGVPIIPLPPIGPAQFLSHAAYNQIRPLHGAVGIRDSSSSG